jgi:hypothetical protein
MGWITTYLGQFLMPLILILLGCIGLQTWRLDSAQKDLATLKSSASIYQEQTDKNLEVLRESIPVMVDKARQNAVNAYRNRYPDIDCSVLSGHTSNGLLPSSPSQTSGSTGANETSVKQLACSSEFIANCAADAQTVIEWQRWSKLNGLEVK